ncbi:phage tail protein [Hyphomicrobium sp. CS1GBMeth3]|uniref:phage tail protein n=1 Tax=Hyphomicrobium sp. CS1GBMeth3 TaxID=1892845 RepID=UPI0009300443|nr:phage tail protein [Hyphomicrobium sp. CS1GBMeth3]
MMQIALLALAFAVCWSSPAAADPISTLIVSAIGLTGAAATVGTALLNAGMAFGLSALSRSLAPKGKRGTAQGGQNLSLRIETDAPRQVILGRQATAGTLAYWQCTGSNNQTLHMVIALADHECHGLAELWVDGKLRSWNAETGVVSGFDSKLKVRFYRGTPDQTVDTVVRNASGGRWTDNERGIGVCYAVVEATEDEKVFKGGIPQIIFVIDGAKLYDPRKDDTAGGSGAHRWNDPTTWEFSDNNAVAIYNVLRGIYQNGAFLMGLLAPADTIRMSDFEAAANACDETIALAAGGTEPRYRCSVIVDVGPGLNPERDALELLIEGMAGDVICSGGIYRIMAGVSRSSVATLTDADFIVTEPLIADPRRPRTELTNAVSASFSDPSRSYNIVPLPTRSSSEDEEADGGYRWTRALDLSGVRSRTQGQRVQEIRRREARRQLRARGSLRARWFILEPGDWVTINSNRRGWSGRTFMIGDTTIAADLASGRDFVEVDAEIDDWSAGMEIADDTVADLPGGGPTLTTVPGFVIEAVTIEGIGGQQLPGVRATWTPIDDATVVNLRIEYRKAGDTVVLGEVVVLDPSTGQYTWTGAIQGGIVYEARAIPVTQPVRGVDWTSWASTGEEAAQQIVGVAQFAQGVSPGSITPEMLDEQTRFELYLVTAQEAAQGSVNERWAKLNDKIIQIAEAVAAVQLDSVEQGAFVRRQEIIRQTDTESLAQDIVELRAQVDEDVASAIQVLEASVFDPDDGLPSKASASALTALSTTVDGNTNSIAEIMEVDSEGNSRWMIGASNDGTVAFFISADGTQTASEITLGAGAIRFANPDPGLNDGEPLSLVSIETVMIDGVPKSRTVFNGEMLADALRAGYISAIELTAIFAHLGSGYVDGVLQSNPENPNGNLKLDFDNIEFELTTAS